ncbi:MAG TPA: fatty acyl-AMP ligase [Thermoanaerobaculia bacterium]|nr:fatty acyl-AMP ligase [Thermoanaerobaculia bacterium]
MSHPAARTLADALVAAAAARPVRSTILVDSELQARPIPHDELLWLARQASAALLEAGLRPGDRMFLILPTGQDFLAAFFGCLLAGIVPCPLSPPLGTQSLSAFETRLAQLARALDIRGLLALPEIAEGASRELGPGFLALTPDLFQAPRDTAAGPPEVAALPDDVAFLQLTSGSTALPKGVVLPHRTVCANLRQMAIQSGFLPGDVSVSWLPLFHDMGLIAGVLLPLTYQQDLLLSTPFSFLRRPAHWLHAVHRYRGTHSTAPVFAFRQIVDRLTARDLAGLDLGSWRIAFIGAEPVHAGILEQFDRLLAPYGFAETALTPCYGMAETTLAATAKPDGERYRTRAVSRRALSAEARVADPEGPEDELVLVDCGRPLEGTHVFIVDEAGRELPEGREGEIVVRGPSVFPGYAGLAEPSRESLAAGFRTGDLGFLDQGGLFITGRRKDVIIISGENHHPAEIEWAVAGVEGVRPTRVAAFGIPDPELGTERLCVMAEPERRAGGSGAEPLDVAIRRRVREETGLLVYDVEIVPAGTIPVTTSGKIRRVRTKEIFLEILAARAAAQAETGMIQDAV